jgi:hypothetical protein
MSSPCPHGIVRFCRLCEEVTADDQLPITEEWLKSVGFKAVESDMGPTYGDHMEKGMINIWEFNDTGKWLFSPADHIEMATRRELRLLAELLKELLP